MRISRFIAFTLLWAALATPARAERMSQCYRPNAECRPIAEQLLFLAFKTLDRLILQCVDPDYNLCDLSPSEFTLLEQISRSLPGEQTGAGLQFASERANPGFFRIDGQVRVAKTGDAVGDPIFINQDLINAPDDPLTFGTASAILTHELGHHHAVLDHAALDRLGAKVKGHVESWMSIASYRMPDGSEARLYSYNASHPDLNVFLWTKAVVFLWDGYDVVSIEDGENGLYHPTWLGWNNPNEVFIGFWIHGLYVDDNSTPEALQIAGRMQYVLMNRADGTTRQRAAVSESIAITLPFRDGSRVWNGVHGVIESAIQFHRAPSNP